jgi:N-acetylglucosaminyl-diphospho-decaprenol L-rhamnosyltransferase
VALVDVVVVSYNSAGTIGDCMQPLASADWVNAIVVDNASEDAGLEVVADLRATVVPLQRNFGFAYGCNRGWEVGSAPYVLFLNPDARVESGSLHRLAAMLEENPSVGLAAPRIVTADGALEYSQRRFARLRSTYAQAFFLQRILPLAGWTDEVVRDRSAYESRHPVEWVSGACMLVRRRALEKIGGWDEGFFLYGEDQDLCRRLWSAGYEVHFDPSELAVHVGGASAPRAGLLPMLASSRIRYAKKHHGRAAVAVERLGVGVGALTHALLTTKGRAWRTGHLRAMRSALLSAHATSSRSARTSLSE